MARATLTTNRLGGSENTKHIALVPNASDATNDHQWLLKKGDILFVWNVGAGAVACVVLGVPDRTNRDVDETTSIGAGNFAVFGPFDDVQGWEQTGRLAWINVDVDTDLKLAVLRVPEH